MTTTRLPVALPGAAAETLMWADPHAVEDAALEQLRTVSRLPWVHGVRVMPDVHLGKGATASSARHTLVQTACPWMGRGYGARLAIGLHSLVGGSE